MASALRPMLRSVTSLSGAATAAKKPPHLLSLADLTVPQLNKLLNSAYAFKRSFRQNTVPVDAQRYGFPNERELLKGRTVGLMFSKRSTRTRVASETATALLGAMT